MKRNGKGQLCLAIAMLAVLGWGGLASGAGGFSPTNASGLHLWLDADDASTIVTNSNAGITNWLDKSGGSRNFTQTTAAAAPSNALAQINGRAVARFNTTSTYIRDDGAAPDVSPGNNNTLFFFLQTGTNTGGPEGFFDSAPSTQYTLRNQPRNIWEFWNGYYLCLGQYSIAQFVRRFRKRNAKRQ